MPLPSAGPSGLNKGKGSCPQLDMRSGEPVPVLGMSEVYTRAVGHAQPDVVDIGLLT